MHKCIRLTIVANQEAKALHGVEEFDGSSCFLAGQLTLRRCFFFLNRDHIANHLEILSGDFAAAINQVELKLLTFSQTFQSSTLNCADVNEHIFAAAFLSDKAEALLAVEEFHSTFAGAYDLSGHAVETAASTAAAARATTTATAAAAITAAETVTTASAAVTIAAAATWPATSTAAAIAITTATASVISVIAWRRESVAAAAKRIVAVLAESVALVPAAPTSSIVTHNSKRTLQDCPSSYASERGQQAATDTGRTPKLFGVPPRRIGA